MHFTSGVLKILPFGGS